ncbi:MAG TPA: tetraacyldisaccharide 4'-kinase [Candidatus Deferrimicrobium sp.]|nr:tetraacyldisaccharide 4'-kinase [Candidatus Deferrimicrobium sp.]
MLERLWKRILRRRTVSLWALPALGLWICSLVYRLLFAIHRRLGPSPVKAPLYVVSVGNIAVGGTGKTSIVNLLGKYLLADGYRVGIVSSGYGRRRQVTFTEPGHKVLQRETQETGDEVKYLASLLPQAVFAVDRSKAVAVRHLADTGLVDVAIVDDGFQHHRLARDIDIVTYDGAVSERLMKPFPYGVLREPVSALARADVIIITRAKMAREPVQLRKKLHRISPRARLYLARFTLTELVGRDRRLPVKYLKDKSLLLFAGVGNFPALRRQVAALCATLDCALELSDHQRYTPDLLEKIKSAAARHNSDVIVTTGKDWVKLGDFDFGRETYYVVQSIDLDPGEENLMAFIEANVNSTKRPS